MEPGPFSPWVEDQRRRYPKRFDELYAPMRAARSDPGSMEQRLRIDTEQAFDEKPLGPSDEGLELESVALHGSYPDTTIVVVIRSAHTGLRFEWGPVEIWNDRRLEEPGGFPGAFAANQRLEFDEETLAAGYGLPVPSYTPQGEPVPIGWHPIALRDALERVPFEILVPELIESCEPSFQFEDRRRYRMRASFVGLYPVNGGQLVVVQSEGLHHKIPEDGWDVVDDETLVREEPYEPGRWRWTAWRWPPDDWLPLRTLAVVRNNLQVFVESDVLSLDDLTAQLATLRPATAG